LLSTGFSEVIDLAFLYAALTDCFLTQLYDIVVYDRLTSAVCAVLFRLTALQKNDLYDLMVTDRKFAEQQNYGNKSSL